MPLLVTSAAGANGDGYGALLAFDRNGKPLGRFSEDGRITDPRGMAIDRESGMLFLNSGPDRVLALDASGTVVRDTGPVESLNPGGGIFGPDGRYYVGLRSTRTIMAFRGGLEQAGEQILPSGIVPFPRGFAFSGGGRLFLASGIGPNGEGTNTILAFAPGDLAQPVVLVADPELSPLDLLITPHGNIVVSSEHPFGAPDAVTSVREYDPTDGHLVRVLSPNGLAESRNPRGLRLDADGTLYWVARDEVIGFDFAHGRCLGPLVRYPRLNGQAVVVFP